MASALREWETFYVIVGSSAAALTGLQFVVIALISESNVGGSEAEVQTFGTPTIVHFSTVLLIAAICSIPHQSAMSLGICITVSAAILLAYIVWIIGRARRVTGYRPVLEDWIFHAWLPFGAYAALLVSGLAAHTSWSLYVIAVAALVLLYVGIHNAWDTAMYISMEKKRAGATSPPPEGDSEDRQQG